MFFLPPTLPTFPPTMQADSDEGQDLCDRLGVDTLPTLQFWRSGQKVWEHKGVVRLQDNLGEGGLGRGRAGGWLGWWVKWMGRWRLGFEAGCAGCWVRCIPGMSCPPSSPRVATLKLTAAPLPAPPPPLLPAITASVVFYGDTVGNNLRPGKFVKETAPGLTSRCSLPPLLPSGVLYYGDTAGNNLKASQFVKELESKEDLQAFVASQPPNVLTVVNVALLGWAHS